MRVLIVDDDERLLRALKRTLVSQRADLTVATASSGDDALSQLATQAYDLVLSDVRMPGLSGDALLQQIKKDHAPCEVVLFTGHASVEQAKWAVRFGAFDYLEKPLDSDEALLNVVDRVGDALQRRGTPRVEAPVSGEPTPIIEGLIGTSASMRQLADTIQSVAQVQASVLLQGESGTGKELVARAIHRLGVRKMKPFVAVNCGALNENLLESELFGHVKGAFTGADQVRRGVFEAADTGTIFLDEVGDMSAGAQVRLLRVLQEGEIRRLGSNDPINVNVRVIAATHVPLRQAVEQGKFREDLFYRLAVLEVPIPPLRARTDDIADIARGLLRRFAEKLGRNVESISPDALAALMAHEWPGNVRELENVVHRAVVLSQGKVVELSSLPPHFADLAQRSAPRPQSASSEDNESFSALKRRVVDGFEKRYLTDLMEQSAGNLSQASRRSGIDRSNLRRMLKAHAISGGIDRERDN